MVSGRKAKKKRREGGDEEPMVEDAWPPPAPSMQARFEGSCSGCSDLVQIGQTVVKTSHRWVHQGRVQSAVEGIDARQPGDCRGCSDPVEPGQRVVKTPHGWAHAQCKQSAFRRAWPGRKTTPSPAFEISCPTCQAPGAMIRTCGWCSAR